MTKVHLPPSHLICRMFFFSLDDVIMITFRLHVEVQSLMLFWVGLVRKKYMVKCKGRWSGHEEKGGNGERQQADKRLQSKRWVDRRIEG